MKKPQIILLLFLAILMLGACTRPLKEITYVHGIETGKVYADSLQPATYLIRPNDHLYIVVLGDDPMNTDFLNLTSATRTNMGQNLELITYTVDERGYISFPQLGEVYVKDKTVLQVQEELGKKIKTYIEGTSVQVKLVDRTITVIGEVNRPGVQSIFKNQLTIFEALGTAGDITDWGNRRNVKLFRQTDDGKEIVSLDLTNPQLINSPYYYILPNDVIYVEASSRVFGFKTLNFVSIFTLALSIVTTILLIYNLFG
ncbi:MAG: polysaccharide biosynthesis/export family protein [Bacteroidales bacterium]|nr:polysaccharide biosynthesis/export family protein [Bacteroidales bacterium]